MHSAHMHGWAGAELLILMAVAIRFCQSLHAVGIRPAVCERNQRAVQDPLKKGYLKVLDKCTGLYVASLPGSLLMGVH